MLAILQTTSWLKFVLMGPIKYKSPSVQVIAWSRTWEGPLPEPIICIYIYNVVVDLNTLKYLVDIYQSVDVIIIDSGVQTIVGTNENLLLFEKAVLLRERHLKTSLEKCPPFCRALSVCYHSDHTLEVPRYTSQTLCKRLAFWGPSQYKDVVLSVMGSSC